MLTFLESEASAGIQFLCTISLCSKLSLVEPQPGIPQNFENSPGPIFLKGLSRRHELRNKHSPEKKKTRITYVKYIKTLSAAYGAILNTYRSS